MKRKRNSSPKKMAWFIQRPLPADDFFSRSSQLKEPIAIVPADVEPARRSKKLDKGHGKVPAPRLEAPLCK